MSYSNFPKTNKKFVYNKRPAKSKTRHNNQLIALLSETSNWVLAAIVLVTGALIGYGIVRSEAVSYAAADPAEVRPFDSNHPVYKPIPTNPTVDIYSSQIVANLATTKNSTFNFDTGSDTPPIYVGKSTDPLWTVNISCSGRSIKVRAPSTIKPGSGSDAPLIILDQANYSFTTSGTQPTEFRMWQAKVNTKNKTITANGFGAGSYRNDGAVLSNEIIQTANYAPYVPRALGQAETCGQNTGSGESYTVGMIRPIDIQRGYIDHAVRVASGYLSDHRWNWPALRTEGGSNARYLTAGPEGAPMGARIYLKPSVNVTNVGVAAAAKLTDPKNKAFAKIFVTALQQYGMILLDGTSSGNSVYFEADSTAKWTSLIGPVNAYGSYNDISRAVASVLPWSSFEVTDASVFNGFASSP